MALILISCQCRATCSGDTFAAWLERAQTPARSSGSTPAPCRGKRSVVYLWRNSCPICGGKGSNPRHPCLGNAIKVGGFACGVPAYLYCDPTALWWCVPGGTGRPLGRLFSMQLLRQQCFQEPGISPASPAVTHEAEEPLKVLSQVDEPEQLVRPAAAN